jgi:signal transduction histidine kinase/AraC-like DNA-binding protein
MNVIYPHALHPKLYSTKENSPYRLNSDIIGSLTESTTGYWIGTEENGINYLDKKTQQIKSLPHYAQSNLIKDIQFRDNKLYIAQFSGGYSVVNLAKNIIRHHSLNRDTLDSRNNVFSIYADSNHTIYLGTNAGLYITNDVQSPPTLIHSIPQNTINRIKEDNYGNIYVQQSGSLFVKHKRTNQFMQLEALNSLLVTDFYVENDQLWLTVADQVYRLTDHRQLEKIVQWKGNPLGTIALTNNKLWVTSKQGLVYYDVKNAYTNILTKEDGLPSNNLVNAKIYVDKTKNILLATQNGLVAFPTEDIAFNTQAPQIYLSSFKINDRTITPDRLEADDDSHNIVVNLNHNETFLSIDFFSSNLIKPTKNRYRYMLKGIDKDWKEISSSSIQYTNLPIGAYTLTVYASNNDLVWSEKPLVISLIVHPPFYLTWWAYILYAILIFTITHFVIKFIVEREVLINSEKEHEKKIKFFTQISHEIRTPLTLITAPLDEIINETADQSATQHKVIRIKKNANKLLSVINELLDFKKLDDKKQQLRLQKTDLNTYLEDAFYLLSDFAQTKNLNYYIRKMDKTGLFWLDTQQFDKVMFNLLSNAIKYTPAGRTVYLELTKTTQGAEIRIVDNGIGISEANQFKIFEEYYREKSTEDVIGTGIGLALTKAIVEQHEGSISCNTLNENSIQWTVFQIELTQQVSRGNDDMSLYANTDTESIPDERDITALSSPVIISGDRKEILLIVEDNKELLEVITSIFHETYEVLTAQDGQEGFDKAKRYLPDLIISDMMMPKMNGLELCDDLKKNTLTSHIPFILLTAVNDETIHTETLKHGANIYITKPFDRSRLYLSVRNLLAIGQKRRKDFRISTAIDNEIDQKFISDLDQLIDDHLMDDNFDVNFISRSMGMSAPVLYRKLKAITDLSLNNYVKSYRLNKAKELLPSRKNISEVAYAVGFSDRKYFSREFKKLFGINPSEYLDRADRG